MWPWASRWWLALWPTPRSAWSSGSTTAVAPRSSSRASPRSGSGPLSSPASSANWRSPAVAPIPDAAARANSTVPASGSRPSLQAIRAARSTRIGSSVKERLEEARRAADSRSPRPPVGSSGVPPSSGTAIELTVKSRSRRSRSIESPRNAATSSFQLPSRAITRQVSNSSESSNGWPSDSSAIRRAAAATSPSKARSTSVTSLPSAASRTAPPTIQARSETSRRPERATSTAGASPKTSSIRVR